MLDAISLCSTLNLQKYPLHLSSSVVLLQAHILASRSIPFATHLLIVCSHMVINMTNGPLRETSHNSTGFLKSSNKTAMSADMSGHKASESQKKATPKNPPPPSISKFFKTTKNARKLMDPQKRVCELDINDPCRVMVYVTPEIRAMRLKEEMPHNQDGLDEMLWNQPLLYEMSQKGMCYCQTTLSL